MAISQRELALQMLAQLRLLDPSVSAEVGTPERKIIDTFASALFDNQIDLDALKNALNIDSKYGAGLERFLNLFGFARQKAVYASGYVTFSRVSPATVNIRIPANTNVVAHIADPGTDGRFTNVPFYTLYDAVLPAGQTKIVAPVRCQLAGNIGNVPINAISEIQGTTIFGVTGVTNEVATGNGKDSESDEELKVRFKNTLFRNLAGTQDQYMALAVATAYTTKANVVGPMSHYREYVQVPAVADNAAYNFDGSVDGSTEVGNGLAGEYTTMLSTIPYAKFVYATQTPVYISNGEAGLGSIFYRQDVDFRMNYADVTARNRGDTYRAASVSLGLTPATTGPTAFQPNFTFTNIYSGTNPDVQAVRPNDIVLVEYAYMSEASRNDFTLGITNAVDVFIDGGNNTLGSTVVTRPTTATAFVDNTTSRYHYENYRRKDYPEKRPVIGNVFMPLFWQPVTDLPNQIVVGTTTYNKNEHYWAVYDVSVNAGTVRARNGIEWNLRVPGKLATDPDGNLSLYTGPTIDNTTGDPIGGAPVPINDYIYDKNVVDLQAALEGSKQVTTDVLAHKSKFRYFKLDVTVMYSPGASVVDTNNQIHDAVDTYLRAQYFGGVIQLSDLLQVIHEVPGIDNVRWTSDTPNSPDLVRVFETDRFGKPLNWPTIDEIQPGAATRQEIQGLYINGAPTGGSFYITNGSVSASAPYNATATQVQTAISGMGNITVTEDTRSTTGVRYPIRSFRIAYTTAVGNGVAANGAQPLLTAYVNPSATPLIGGPYIIKNDFFIRDDELARLAEDAFTPTVGVPDSVPGLIIRPRAQSTWIRTN